jgi:DNA-binding winged helix-turn-helix (wHTH) protein/tetratricopeptide (TPR) repeat protein
MYGATMPAMALLRFGVFELDQSSGELTRQGRRVPIAPQPFHVLSLLVSRAGEVITRAELKRQLWGEHTHVDFDRSLNFCMACVRRALGDDARRPRFVETIPRRGYRFLADVRRAPVAPRAVAAPSAASPVSPAARPPSSPAVWLRWAAAALLPVLLSQGPAPVPVHTRVNARPAALEAFDRGQRMSASARDVDGQRRSLAAFDDARRLDDRFAEAHFAFASTFLTLADARALPERAALEQARAAAIRAVTLEETAESRRLLGELRLRLDWDWTGARREFERAIALVPDWDLGQAAYAQFLSASGEDAAAIAAMARAERLSPSCDLLLRQSAAIYYRAHQYDAALRALDRAAALAPERDRSDRDAQVGAHDAAFFIQVQRRDWAAAHTEAIALVRLYGAASDQVQRFVAMPGRDAVAAFLRRSEELTRTRAVRGHVPPTRIAVINALNGHDDEALAWLEQSARNRNAELPLALRDPAFDALRHSDRFHAIDRQVHSAMRQ